MIAQNAELAMEMDECHDVSKEYPEVFRQAVEALSGVVADRDGRRRRIDRAR